MFDVTFSETVTGLLANDFERRGRDRLRVRTGRIRIDLHRHRHGLLGRDAHRPGSTNAVTDTAGNNNVQTDGPTVTIDRTAPVATLDLQASPDSGSSTTDNLTNATSLVYDVTFMSRSRTWRPTTSPMPAPRPVARSGHRPAPARPTP